MPDIWGLRHGTLFLPLGRYEVYDVIDYTLRLTGTWTHGELPCLP